MLPNRVAIARHVLQDRLSELRHGREQRAECERVEHALQMLQLLLNAKRAA